MKLHLPLLAALCLCACDRTPVGNQFNQPKTLRVYHSSEQETPDTQEATAETIPVITSEQFPKAIKGNEVLIEFYAPWCGACKQIAPVLERLHQHHPTLSIYKVNTDNSPDLCSRYNVIMVPTLMMFHNGHASPGGPLTGFNDMDTLERFIQSDYL